MTLRTLTSLRFTIPAAAIAAVLAVAAATSAVHLSILSQSLRDDTARSLVTTQRDIAGRIEATFADLHRDVAARADSGTPAQAIATLTSLLVQAGPAARDTLRGSLLSDTGDGTRYRMAYDQLAPYFTAARAEHGYYDVFLINRDGDVVLTLAKERDLLANVLTGELSTTGLSRAFSAALEAPAGKAVFADYLAYPPSGNALAAFLAAPVRDAGGQVVGVYAVQVPDLPLSLPETAPDTLEVTVAGPDNLLRLAGQDGQGAPLAIGADAARSAALAAAMAGESGVTDATGEDGTPRAVAYAPIRLAGADWAISASLPHRPIWEHLGQPLDALALDLSLILLAAFGTGLAALLWLGLPLSRLARALPAVAEGASDAPLPGLTRRDEIGDIARGAGLRSKEAPAIAGEPALVPDIFDSLPVAAMVAGPDGRVLHANAAMAGLAARHAEMLALACPALDPRHPVGSTLPVPLFDPAEAVTETDFGTTLHFTSRPVGPNARLVTVQEQSDQRRANSIFDAILANQVMLELGPDARVINANHHACRRYGYTAEEFVGLDVRRLMQDEGRSLPDLMRRLADCGTLTERQHRRTKTGDSVWVDCTFNAIRDDANRIRRIFVVCVDVTEAVENLAAAETAERTRRAALGGVVGALGSALERLAAGDLTATIDDSFPAEYETLRDNFNGALRRLDLALGGIAAGASNIRNGAAEITEAADDLSRRTESQAATLEETAAALDMLTASVKASALGADEADRTVGAARVQAETSGAVVIEAVAAMGEIEQSSRQIRQIIGVIDDIAFQTNLLALNAGVEAARAGDAGRGFAVVASEVRALAQRSSDAAREIKDLISASSRHVERGVGLVGETGEALNAIVGGVTEIAARVSAIAQSAREQATGLSEINAGMANMDQVTQQNAAMVEESTAASHSLRNEAETLASVVGHFRLRHGTPAATPRRAEAAQAAPRTIPPATAARTAGAAPRGLPRLQAQAAAPVSASGSAPVGAHVATSGGWEEF